MNSMAVKTNTMTVKMKHKTLDPILEKKIDNFNFGVFVLKINIALYITLILHTHQNFASFIGNNPEYHLILLMQYLNNYIYTNYIIIAVGGDGYMILLYYCM